MEGMFKEIESTFEELFPGMGWDAIDGIATVTTFGHDVHAAFTKETREMYCARTLIAFSCWAMSPDSNNSPNNNGRTWLKKNKARVRELFVSTTGSLKQRYREILELILEDTFEFNTELGLPDMEKGTNVLLDGDFLRSQGVIYIDGKTLKFAGMMKDNMRVSPLARLARERLTRPSRHQGTQFGNVGRFVRAPKLVEHIRGKLNEWFDEKKPTEGGNLNEKLPPS